MLSWEEYFDRIVSVQLQFDLARKALVSFQDKPEAVERYIEGELEEVRKSIIKENEDQTDQLKQHLAFMREMTESYFNSVKASIPARVAEVENRLNQNEFISLVTLFEGFIKDIHRQVLRQKPELLRADRQIPLGRVIAIEKEKLIEEEIEREVQILDRKNVEEKVKYFRERLRIDWFDGTIVPLLARVLELRNVILHVDPNKKIEVLDIGLANTVCFTIPWVSVAQAAVLYPSGFKMIEGLDEGKAKALLKQ